METEKPGTAVGVPPVSEELECATTAQPVPQEDKEIKVLAAVIPMLSELPPDAIARVLRYAAARYNIALPGKQLNRQEAGSLEQAQEFTAKDEQYPTFAELYDAADPATEAERVLVAGYWLQVVNQQAELESLPLNAELKDTGHQIANIPRTLDVLMKSKPRLLVQLKKQGAARQGRRKFKLTTEGIKKVKGMLNRVSE